MQKNEVLVILSEIEERFGKEVSVEGFISKIEKWVERQKGDEIEDEKVFNKLTKTALEYVDIDNPKWEFIGGFLLAKSLYALAAKNRGYDKKEEYGDFYSLIKLLSEYELPGGYTVYNTDIINKYSKAEIEELGKEIVAERDFLFTYLGLFLLNDRYLARPQKDEVYELPQERFMVIAMTLMQNETVDRLSKVKEAYWAMSNLYMTVATPTLSNAGKSSGQLSSCFIDVMDDSIDGIYGTNHDTARVSKYGGGQGVYIGKVRSIGSSIQGRLGVSSGTVPWIRLLNQTAVSVDQLG